jgi:hypothetical protein
MNVGSRHLPELPNTRPGRPHTDVQNIDVPEIIIAPCLNARPHKDQVNRALLDCLDFTEGR